MPTITKLGAVIIQNGKPIAFYGRKLTGPQSWYTVSEKVLLSTVETLTEFCTILLGQQLKIYTDHKNLTCKNFSTDCILVWRIIQEEYSPYIVYITDNKNMVADALSHLPINKNQETTHESTYTTETMLKLYKIK